MFVEPTNLLGEWQLDRWVHDVLTGLSGTVTGQLTLAAERDEIAWQERGTLLWNGSWMPVSRAYRFRRLDGRWWLCFPDGRPFHAWSPGQWVHHPCSEDDYRGLITIDSLDSWHMQWDVRGPATQQRISTRFTRPGSHPEPTNSTPHLSVLAPKTDKFGVVNAP